MPRYEVEVQVRLATTLTVHIEAESEADAQEKVERIERDLLHRALSELDADSLDYWHTDIEAVREEREVAAAW